MQLVQLALQLLHLRLEARALTPLVDQVELAQLLLPAARTLPLCVPDAKPEGEARRELRLGKARGGLLQPAEVRGVLARAR